MASGRIRQSVQQQIENSNHHLAALFVASFLEATIVPIPLEAILIPYLFTHRDRLWSSALAVTLGCLAGALVGYGLGLGFLQAVGDWIREHLTSKSQAETFEQNFQQNGFLAILATGISPIPFQLAMLTAGAMKYPLALFLLATAIARGIRYFGLAWLVHQFGEKAEKLWNRNKWLAGVVGLALIGLLYGLAKLIGAISVSG